MDERPHKISHAFLAGAIVENGQLGWADVSYVMESSKLLASYGIPMSDAFASAGTNLLTAQTFTQTTPYDFANISPLHGGVDYLQLSPKERGDILILCNIPVGHGISDSIDITDHHQVEFYKTQQKAETFDSQKLSEQHTAANWARRIEEDRPYVVTIFGGTDNFRAHDLVSKSYISLSKDVHDNGILIDRYHLQDLQYMLLQKSVAEKKMSPLLPVIRIASEEPKKQVFQWNDYSRRFEPY